MSAIKDLVALGLARKISFCFASLIVTAYRGFDLGASRSFDLIFKGLSDMKDHLLRMKFEMK
jgi:hypothetical protein